MDGYKRLHDNIRNSMGNQKGWIFQGIVKSIEIDDLTATVTISDLDISGVRLRASESPDDNQTIIIPTVGKPVLLAAVAGDMNNMVIIGYDDISSISFNGGKKGGLVLVNELTAKLNDLVNKFNNHIHSITAGSIVTTGSATTQTCTTNVATGKTTAANSFNANDYQNNLIKQ